MSISEPSINNLIINKIKSSKNRQKWFILYWQWTIPDTRPFERIFYDFEPDGAIFNLCKSSALQFFFPSKLGSDSPLLSDQKL